MRIDLDRLRELNADLYTSATRQAFGDQGVQALRNLVSSIIKIYRRVDPTSRNQALVIFADAGAEQILSSYVLVHHVHSIEHIADELDGPCMVRVNGDSSLDVYSLDPSALTSISRMSVVYHHHLRDEKFLIDGSEYLLTNPMIGFGSVFCKPTFTDLVTALDTYRMKAVAYSSCEILKQAWYDQARFFFKAKPERIMRKSLNQYLSNVLDDAEVRPEQNVDETHPVDIKVSFSLTDMRAIIEIKWLGDSVDSVGKITTGYTQARAVSGAKQLADYLDLSHEWAPGTKTRGYLVVFDARRKGLSDGVATLDRADALHYKDSDITYSPNHSVLRHDFAPPVRMYMFPKTA